MHAAVAKPRADVEEVEPAPAPAVYESVAYAGAVYEEAIVAKMSPSKPSKMTQYLAVGIVGATAASLVAGIVWPGPLTVVLLPLSLTAWWIASKVMPATS